MQLSAGLSLFIVTWQNEALIYNLLILNPPPPTRFSLLTWKPDDAWIFIRGVYGTSVILNKLTPFKLPFGLSKDDVAADWLLTKAQASCSEANFL